MIARALARFVWRTPASTLIAFLGVVLGVSSIVSVHLISARIDSQLSQLIPSPVAQFSHFVHGSELTTHDYFSLRQAWRDGELPDVERIAPIIDEQMMLAGKHVRLIGLDLVTDALSMPARGALLFGADSQASNSDFSWQGVWVDPTLTELPDIAINGSIAAPPGTVVADIAKAQQLLGWQEGAVSYLALDIRAPFAQAITWAGHLLPGFSAGMPTSTPQMPALSDWRVLALADQHPSARFGRSILFNVSALSLLALLVSWFVIYQVAVSWVRRLWPVLERLHVSGVLWSTLGAYFVGMMSVIGLVAGVVGLSLGKFLAQQLLQLSGVTNNFSVVIDGWLVAKSLGGAVLICACGGWLALRLARSKVEVKSGALFVGLGGCLLAGYCVWQPSTGLIGGFVAIALASLLAVTLVSPLLRALRRRASTLSGPWLLRLGLRESIWYPNDLSVAISALALAVAVAMGMGIMVDSFRADFERMLDRRLSYDLVVQAPQGGSGAQLDTALELLQDRSDVSYLASYVERPISVGGISMILTATIFNQRESARYGFARSLLGNEVLVSEQTAGAIGLQIGSVLEIDGHELSVAHVFSSFGDPIPRVLIGRDHPLANGSALGSVHADIENVELVAAQLSAELTSLQVESQSQIRKDALHIFDRTFTITTILIWIALLVAVLGLFVAISALRLNRRTGRHLLETVGVTRSEKLLLDGILGLGVGVSALVVAVPLGLIIAWLLCHIINPRGFGWSIEMQLTAQAVLAPLAWGLCAAIAAGVLRIGQREEGAFNAAR